MILDEIVDRQRRALAENPPDQDRLRKRLLTPPVLR